MSPTARMMMERSAASLPNAIGVLLGSLSVLGLIGFCFPGILSNPMSRLVSHYEWVVTQILPQVEPHRKFVFALLIIFFFRDAANYKRMGHKAGAYARYALGTAIAVVAGSVVGGLDRSKGDLIQFYTAALPLCACFVYWFVWMVGGIATS
jgi:hypothetical protein